MGKKGGGFYAVRGGSTPGVYLSWDEAVRHGAQGVPGVEQKKFQDRQSAEMFVRNCGGNAGGGGSVGSGSGGGGGGGGAAGRGGGGGNASLGSSVSAPSAFARLMSSGTASSSKSKDRGGGVESGELAIFTDGACKTNHDVASGSCKAGWGVCVVEGCLGVPPAGGRVLAEVYGPVELDAASPHFLGAEFGSNNTGELSAICEALRWLTEHEPTSRPAVIIYDSEYAANQAQGFHKAHKNVRTPGSPTRPAPPPPSSASLAHPARRASARSRSRRARASSLPRAGEGGPSASSRSRATRATWATTAPTPSPTWARRGRDRPQEATGRPPTRLPPTRLPPARLALAAAAPRRAAPLRPRRSPSRR